jgi:hypothetical protein
MERPRKQLTSNCWPESLESSTLRFRSIAGCKDSFRRNDDPQAVVAFPPIPSGVVESRSGFTKRTVALLQAYVKVFRADAQNDSAFVVK